MHTGSSRDRRAPTGRRTERPAGSDPAGPGPENGLAGHLGFTTTTLGKTKCGSGRIGTFESVASGKAMSKIAKQKGYKNVTAKEIFNYSLNKKKWVKELNSRFILIRDPR